MQRFLEPHDDPPGATRARQSIAIDGVLIGTVELHHCSESNQPPDHLYIYRDGPAWTAVTVRHTERHVDNPSQHVTGSARVIIEHFGDLHALRTVVQHRWGQPAGQALLNLLHAAGSDPSSPSSSPIHRHLAGVDHLVPWPTLRVIQGGDDA